MSDYGRRIVVDLAFETVLGETCRAIREEGLQLVARIDVRDRFWSDLRQDFRHYYLLEAWSPDLALDALRHDLDAGILLPTTFAIYELPDGETAVIAKEPFAPMTTEPEGRHDAVLAAIADRESIRVARILDRLQHSTGPVSSLYEMADCREGAGFASPLQEKSRDSRASRDAS